MKFSVSNDPAQHFDTAEAALVFASRLVWLKPALFGTYVDCLNRGGAVSWADGFGDLTVWAVEDIQEKAA